MAYCDASTSRMNCLAGSGGVRTGAEVTTLISLSSACVHSSVHLNSAPFFNRLVRGLAVYAKLRIKGLWKPKMPKVLQTCLTEVSC